MQMIFKYNKRYADKHGVGKCNAEMTVTKYRWLVMFTGASMFLLRIVRPYDYVP